MGEEERLSLNGDMDADLLHIKYQKLKRYLSIAIVVGVILLVLCAGLFGIVLFQYTSNSDESCGSTTTSPTPSPTPTVTPSTVRFFQISDIHLDLRYSNSIYPLAEYGSDGGEVLLNATLSAMRDVNSDPAFILVSGDFVAHNRPTETIQFDTLSRASMLIADYFPSTQVYPAMGNNDVFPDYHYPINTSTTWMSNLTSLWSMWLSTDQQQTFNPYGYYCVNSLWDNGPRLVVLNSLVYSSRLVDSLNRTVHDPTPPEDLPDDPNMQFAWLESQLNTAKQNSQQVIVQFHIPPGVNAYDGSRTWHDKFTTQFNQLISNYSDVITASLGAHYHSDEILVLSNSNGLLLNPSISPDHYNNPSFREYIGDSNSGKLLNFIQYYTDLEFSNGLVDHGKNAKFFVEYDFQSAWGFDQVNGSTIAGVAELLTTSTAAYMRYLDFKYVFYATDRQATLCAMFNQDYEPYQNCTAIIP